MSEVFLRRTSVQTAKSVVTTHECWDAPRFIASQQAEQRKLRDEDQDHDIITTATQDEYRAFRKG